MILADTSVWIDHFRSGNKELQNALNQGQIVTHSWIIAELALGLLRDRVKTLAMLDLLPQIGVAKLTELRLMMETRGLYGRGIGLTDTQLLASVLINPPTLLWTKDRPLRRLAETLRIHANLP